MLRAALMLSLSIALAAPAAAQIYDKTDGHDHMTRQEVDLQHEDQLAAFRRKALAVQEADRGKLTPAHLANLQSKLDRLNTSYRTELLAIGQSSAIVDFEAGAQRCRSNGEKNCRRYR